MAAVFDRFYIPSVSLVTPQGVLSNLDGRGIKFEWSVTRDNTVKPDQGVITIYNLAPAFSGLMHEAWSALNKGIGYLVQFLIGWDGVPQLLIQGDVWNLVPQDRNTPGEVKTVLHIGDGNRAMRDGITTKSFKNVNVSIVLEYLVQLPMAPADIGGGGLGLIYPPESKALIKAASSKIPVQSWGNISTHASTREAINLIMDTLGLEWRVQNGAFIVMRGGVINRPGPIISPRSGLISYALRNDGGIQFSALANPDLEPGIQTVVQDNNFVPFGAPLYRVEKAAFQGATDGNSIMNVEAAKAT